MKLVFLCKKIWNNRQPHSKQGDLEVKKSKTYSLGKRYTYLCCMNNFCCCPLNSKSSRFLYLISECFAIAVSPLNSKSSRFLYLISECFAIAVSPLNSKSARSLYLISECFVIAVSPLNFKSARLFYPQCPPIGVADFFFER